MSTPRPAQRARVGGARHRPGALGAAEVGDLLRVNLNDEVAALETLAGHAQAVGERTVL